MRGCRRGRRPRGPLEGGMARTKFIHPHICFLIGDNVLRMRGRVEAER